MKTRSIPNLAGLFGFALLANCSTVTAGLPQGGADGGGGDIIAAIPVKPEQIQLYSDNWKTYLLASLYYQEEQAKRKREAYNAEELGVSDAGLNAARARLFPPNSQEDVFQKLPDFHFDFSKDPSCLDLNSQPKAGSAFNENPAEVCISRQMLSQTQTVDSFEKQAVALQGHELVHRMGGNHDEAKAFQDFVFRTPFEGSKLIDIQSKRLMNIALRINTKGILDTLKSAERPTSIDETLHICGLLEDLNDNILAFLKSPGLGMRLYRYSKMLKFKSALVQSYHMKTFCIKNLSRGSNIPNLIPLAKLKQTQVPNGPGIDSPIDVEDFDVSHGKIRTVGYLDWNTLQEMIEEITPNLPPIEVPASPRRMVPLPPSKPGTGEL